MNAFAGTAALLRLILRRDRVLMPAWVLVMALLPVAGTAPTASLYPTDQARLGYISDLAGTPALIMFYGRRPQPDLGALMFWRTGTAMGIMGLIGLLVVIRHTRVEEEAGRRELVRSAAVGRFADQTAALVATSAASLLVGALVALGMTSQHTPAGGAAAMGLAWASAGIAFGAVGAVAAQLTRNAAAARGLGIVVLSGSFLLRATGDVAAQRDTGLAWLSWIPPLGWAYQVRAYDQNRWWLLGLLAGLAAALGAAAFALSARRDLGAGLRAARPGPARAARYLRTPLALGWRLQRGTLAAWTAGFVVLGLLIGGTAQSAGKLLGNNQQLRQATERLGGSSVTSDVFIAAVLNFGGLLGAGYAISAALRMRSEEDSLRIESLLAAPVNRVRWVTSHLGFALLGPAAGLAAAGLTAGLVYGAQTGRLGFEVSRVLSAALAQVPAVWVLAGLAVAAYGLLPRLSAPVAWVALSLCALLGQVGALLQLDRWLLDTSPFTHVPHLPGGAVSAAPLISLTAVAAALTGAGITGFRRRDIPAN